MDTVTNIANAASKAIWGEQPSTTQGNETAGIEPASGVKGKGDLNEPYDKGNEDPITATTHPSSNSISPTSNTTTLPDRTADKMNSNTSNTFGSSNTHGSDPTGPHHSHLANQADPRIDSDHAGSYGNTTVGGLTGNSTGGGLTGNTHSSDTTGGLTSNTHSHGSDPTGPHDSHLSNKADPRVDSDHIGSQGNVGTHSSHTTQHSTPSSIPTNPVTGADRGVQPHQDTDKTGVIGGHSDPLKTSQNTASESKSNTGAPSSGAVHTKQQGAANPTEEPSAESFLKTKDPNDHSGEPMHMHAGAGDGSTVPKTQEERRESKVGNPGGQEHGRETAEGTGEQWIKTSGMAADGGDFDATKPGAGREADRLMEQKGIHKSTPGKPSEPVAETSAHGSHGSHGNHGTEGKEKVPLTQKIKEKLHIGSKHD